MDYVEYEKLLNEVEEDKMTWYPGFGRYWDDNMESEKDDPEWIEDYLKALEEIKEKPNEIKS